MALSQQSSETTLTALRSAGYLPSDASSPTAGIPTGPNQPRSDLPSQGLDLDTLARDFGVDIERILGPALGSPVELAGNEESARQRARAIAETLRSVGTSAR